MWFCNQRLISRRSTPSYVAHLVLTVVAISILKHIFPSWFNFYLSLIPLFSCHISWHWECEKYSGCQKWQRAQLQADTKSRRPAVVEKGSHLKVWIFRSFKVWTKNWDISIIFHVEVEKVCQTNLIQFLPEKYLIVLLFTFYWLLLIFLSGW